MNLSKEKYKSSTKPMLSHINVGSGQEFTISEVAKTISNVVGFKGKIEYDERKPEGAPRKLLNSESLIKLGWAPAVTFEKGISIAYNDFINKV
jgi:GDP-L-fucose synthase